MKVDLEYYRNIPAGDAVVKLEKSSLTSAEKAAGAAQEVGLGVRIFSYSDILAQVQEGQNPISVCADVTGTTFNEQLKSMFISDAHLSGQSFPNAAIAVVQYSQRIDFQKLAPVLSEFSRRGKPVGTLKFMSAERLGVPRGFLGINPKCLMVPALFSPLETERGMYKPYTDEIASSRILDQSLRALSRFCMLVGYEKADALVVIEGQNGQLGNRLDTFFREYFEGGRFAIADITQTENS